jgi:hypothetical protein
MKLVDLSSKDEQSRSVLRIIGYVSLIVLIAILVYAILDSLTHPPGVVGLDLVSIEFPPSSISPIYFKPITILYIAAALLLYAGLELNKERVRSLSVPVKTTIRVFSFIAAVVFIFEVGYNFAYWSGQIAAESIRGTLNPDLISNPFPNLTNPINVVFASRLFAFFTIAGIYVFYFMTKLEGAEDGAHRTDARAA